MVAKLGLREYFLACRLTSGVRESVRKTAKYHKKTTEEVCSRLKLDPVWSDSGMTIEQQKEDQKK